MEHLGVKAKRSSRLGSAEFRAGMPKAGNGGDGAWRAPPGAQKQTGKVFRIVFHRFTLHRTAILQRVWLLAQHGSRDRCFEGEIVRIVED